jgi:hypothetical protein
VRGFLARHVGVGLGSLGVSFGLGPSVFIPYVPTFNTPFISTIVRESFAGVALMAPTRGVVSVEAGFLGSTSQQGLIVDLSNPGLMGTVVAESGMLSTVSAELPLTAQVVVVSWRQR